VVRVWSETLTIPTCLPSRPDKDPMFLEKRVYQGSSGKVYPLPFTDRIDEHPVERKWRVVWIENEFLRAMVLPELGGRIHRLQDKTNGYDLVYHQSVIKPALVGLAGPWVSGGIEFNWPQHHRPATFLPLAVEIEEHADGSQTIWCGDHCPMTRMKGMHGVCLHPGRAYLELKVRAYNRTPLSQTFLWWANVATRVHEAYQSFFPPDVYYVADHARRSMSEYPLAKGFYYGVNYGERARKGMPKNEVPARFIPPHAGGRAPINYAPNDLSFYANIPVPTSYMCMGSQEDFFGGYDHAAQAGIMLGVVLAVFQQWCGINPIFNYAEEIFRAAGYDISSVLKNIAWTGSVNMMFTFVALGTVDRAGRRPLMLFGALGLAAIYTAMGFCYANHVQGLPVLLLVLAAIGCYAMSLAPVTWVVISEIFPNRIRGAAMSVAVTALWIACFILTYTFPILNAKLGPAGTFWLYAVICVAGFVFIFFKLPETKGKTLEQLENDLAD